VEPGVVRRCFAQGVEVTALLVSHFERRSILTGSLWRGESKSEHQPLRGAARMKAFLAVTLNEHESIASLPSNHSLLTQTAVSQANASLMEHGSPDPADIENGHLKESVPGAVRLAKAYHRGYRCSQRSTGSTTGAGGKQVNIQSLELGSIRDSSLLRSMTELHELGHLEAPSGRRK